LLLALMAGCVSFGGEGDVFNLTNRSVPKMNNDGASRVSYEEDAHCHICSLLCDELEGSFSTIWQLKAEALPVMQN